MAQPLGQGIRWARSLSDVSARDEAKEVRPDARPQARKNRRCIRWNALSRSEQRLVHLSELGLSFLSLSEPLFRRNRRRWGTEVVTKKKKE